MRKLTELSPGETGFIEIIDSNENSFKRHLIDLGITPGAKVTVVRFAPLGDPIQIEIRGYELSIRKSDAKLIMISENKIK